MAAIALRKLFLKLWYAKGLPRLFSKVFNWIGGNGSLMPFVTVILSTGLGEGTGDNSFSFILCKLKVNAHMKKVLDDCKTVSISESSKPWQICSSNSSIWPCTFKTAFREFSACSVSDISSEWTFSEFSSSDPIRESVFESFYTYT